MSLDDIRSTWGHVPTQHADVLYMCVSGEYILNAFLCDSVMDCISGDDEQNCCEYKIMFETK